MTAGRNRFPRLLLCALVLTVWMVHGGRAHASDGAIFNPIGFSSDGRYFAYEQFGVADPTGFPYWTVSVIDTSKNVPAPGSPASVVVEDSTRSVLDARAKLTHDSTALLKAAGISEPYVLLGANPNTQPVPDRRSLTFERWYNSGGADPGTLAFANLRHELRVETITVPKPGTCDPAGGPFYGFELKMKDQGAKDWKSLYADDGLPEGRGCAVSYEVAAVIAKIGVPSTDRLVAIIGVYSDGFQGLNHRYIAIPFELPK